MAICKYCDVKMPDTVLVAHYKKRHSEEHEVKRTPEYHKPVKVEEKAGSWNWGELNTCRQCMEEWPVRLMEFHMHIRHGM